VARRLRLALRRDGGELQRRVRGRVLQLLRGHEVGGAVGVLHLLLHALLQQLLLDVEGVAARAYGG
jgi:hypothetical protein